MYKRVGVGVRQIISKLPRMKAYVTLMCSVCSGLYWGQLCHLRTSKVMTIYATITRLMYRNIGVIKGCL